MSYSMTPIAPETELLIDGTALGTVRSFSERTVVEPIKIYTIGQNLPAKILPGKRHYELHLTRLITDKSIFSEEIDLHPLHSFTLVLSGGGRLIRFSGCEITALSVRTELGVGQIEEATVIASARNSF